MGYLHRRFVGKIRTFRAAGVIQRLFPFLARAREVKSMAALPDTSDVDLLGDGKGAIDLHADLALSIFFAARSRTLPVQ
jgi:hypothetical protein